AGRVEQDRRGRPAVHAAVVDAGEHDQRVRRLEPERDRQEQRDGERGADAGQHADGGADRDADQRPQQVRRGQRGGEALHEERDAVHQNPHGPAGRVSPIRRSKIRKTTAASAQPHASTRQSRGAPSSRAAVTKRAVAVTTYPSSGSSSANPIRAATSASTRSPARGCHGVPAPALGSLRRASTSSAAPTTPSATPTGSGTAAGPTAAAVSGSRTASTITRTAAGTSSPPNAAVASTVCRS